MLQAAARAVSRATVTRRAEVDIGRAVCKVGASAIFRGIGGSFGPGGAHHYNALTILAAA